MCTDIINMFVNFVGNNHYLRILGQYGCQSCQFFFTIHRTCRVRRRTKNQSFGFRSNSSFQLFRSNLEILFNAGRNDNRSTFCHLHHFRIAYPVRGRYNHFITRIYQNQDSIANRLFGTIRTRNLSGSIFKTVLFFQLLNNRIA